MTYLASVYVGEDEVEVLVDVEVDWNGSDWDVDISWPEGFTPEQQDTARSSVEADAIEAYKLHEDVCLDDEADSAYESGRGYYRF